MSDEPKKEDSTMLTYVIGIAAPFVRYEEYSRLTGMPVGTIKDYVSKGKIIIKNKDRPSESPLVNMVAMTEIAARETLEKLGERK